MKLRVLFVLTPLLSACLLLSFRSVAAQHEPNGSYRGPNLDRVAFPIGGIGTGMFCLEGTGAISHLSVSNRMDFFNEPSLFAAVTVLGNSEEENVARVLEGPIPNWKYFGRPNSGNGAPGSTYGLPRFGDAQFIARFPFAQVVLRDEALPIRVELTGWSPFTPPDPDKSSLPVGALEYKFINETDQPVRAVFTFNSRNFINGGGSIGPIPGGFVLHSSTGVGREKKASFAWFVDGADEVTVDHCWFRGGWWDALTIAWNNIQKGEMIANPAVDSNSPGATLAVPFEVPANGEKTIRLLEAWYAPDSTLGSAVVKKGGGAAFRESPARGTARGQNSVSGYLGRQLVNTYYPDADAQSGNLVSAPFEIRRDNIHFLLGGGSGCPVELVVADKVVRTVAGSNTETLDWTTWNVADLKGKKAVIRLVDQQTGPWGHINLDHIVFSDEPISNLLTGQGNEIVEDINRVYVFEDFEGERYEGWTITDLPAVAVAEECDPESGCCPTPETYIPWYATQFSSIYGIASAWRSRYNELRTESEKFSNAFYDSSLPPEIVEAVAANLTILKSPTVLRQHDGRLWCWEGCSDSSGCCEGSCTHVWNYAQAICHLFPSLERSLRQSEYNEGSSEGTGRQAFRVTIPVMPGGVAFDAADGQLGGIMKVYREWKISSDNQWLADYWSKVKTSLDYMIELYDPRHTGLLEESHHNTYDINYFGPDGHCGSFYLGALVTAIEMGKALGENVAFYEELLAKGQVRMTNELFNGEYFIQLVMKEGLSHNFDKISPSAQSTGYQSLAKLVNEQGPKYQYGNGCLSDGVLGLWMAKTSGCDADIIDPKLVESHLLAIYKYNMKDDLSAHANPQRPSYAMGNDGGLLLCTWPRRDKPLLPFVYSDEVWTGIEYQVASHLMMLGHRTEGLDIVQVLRKRHDGVRRNPFNEYECGHWYARAMASYALLQGWSGVRYEATTGTLFVDSNAGDFKTFLSTATGYGTVESKQGKVSLKVISGAIDVKKTVSL